jgi:hypothetical protein
VLLTSGYTAHALSEEHGIVDEFPLLPKPYRVAELGRALRGALAPCQAPANANSKAPRVLVVEDDMFVRLSAVTLLRECGFEVVGTPQTAKPPWNGSTNCKSTGVSICCSPTSDCPE